MSIYNCDVHGGRVPGSLEAAYPALLRGAYSYSRHLRLCPEHMDSLLRPDGWGFTPASSDKPLVGDPVCSACRQVALDASALDPCFLTVYRRRSERADYFAFLCGPCGDKLVMEYELNYR